MVKNAFLYSILENEYLSQFKTDANLKKYKINLNYFIDDLYNKDIKIIFPLDEMETLIIRKLYGVFTDNIIKKQKEVAKELNVSEAFISNEKNKIHTAILKRIIREEEIDCITVFDILNSKINLKNINLGEILSNNVLNNLREKSILTLNDLLSIGKIGLISIIGNGKKYEEVKNIIDKLGLNFIEDIDFLDKKNILMSYKNTSKLLNTDLIWLDLSTSLLKSLKNNNIYKIKDLKRLKYYSKELIDRLTELNLLYLIEVNTNYEFVDKNIEELDLSLRAYTCLKNGYKINTLKELIRLRTIDIINTRNIGLKSYNEIIDKVHELGLLFADELDNKNNDKDKLLEIKNKLIYLSNKIKDNKINDEVNSLILKLDSIIEE